MIEFIGAAAGVLLAKRYGSQVFWWLLGLLGIVLAAWYVWCAISNGWWHLRKEEHDQ